MENTDQIHSFIRLVMNENLAQAQSVIREALNTKLSEALDEKFEAYAPAIFEELDLPGEESPDGDIDNDGDEDESDDYLLNRRKVRGEAINEEEGDEGEEEEADEGDEGDEQPMQNAPPTMQQYSAPTGGSSTAGSDGY